MKQIDYFDQAPRCVEFYDRRVSSTYTEHGIRCIDSQFCIRIQNLYQKIIKIIYIPVERMLSNQYDGYKDSKLKNHKPEISIDDFINKKWGGWGNELRIIWENGCSYEFFYWDETLVIDPKTGREDPVVLREHIINNIHLHQDIKDNLLQNLDSRLLEEGIPL